MADQFTIFGGRGFVGSEVARQLAVDGDSVAIVGRDNWPAAGTHLGHVIFTVGMTADFRSRLVETIEMQIMRLHEALTNYTFDSFLSLSSARVYEGAISTDELAPLSVRPAETNHVYNISKLAGESRCFAVDNPAVRVVRLSNVYGAADDSNLFMTAVLRDAIRTGTVSIGQAPGSSKDYILVDDAARLIIAIARGGRHRLYNVACGTNFTHRQIADALEAKGYAVDFKPGGATVTFPAIEISRVCDEFSTFPRGPADVLPGLIDAIRKQRGLQ